MSDRSEVMSPPKNDGACDIACADIRSGSGMRVLFLCLSSRGDQEQRPPLNMPLARHSPKPPLFNDDNLLNKVETCCRNYVCAGHISRYHSIFGNYPPNRNNAH